MARVRLRISTVAAETDTAEMERALRRPDLPMSERTRLTTQLLRYCELDTLAMVTKALAAWTDITPLARNEWICWVTSPKKTETRTQHIRRATEDLAKGKRRPCCWPGCPHR